jgi:hypothetical protein
LILLTNIFKSENIASVMEKEVIGTLAQLLNSMKDAVSKLEDAQKSKDLATFNQAKQDILNLQSQIDRLL